MTPWKAIETLDRERARLEATATTLAQLPDDIPAADVRAYVGIIVIDCENHAQLTAWRAALATRWPRLSSVAPDPDKDRPHWSHFYHAKELDILIDIRLPSEAD